MSTAPDHASTPPWGLGSCAATAVCLRRTGSSRLLVCVTRGFVVSSRLPGRCAPVVTVSDEQARQGRSAACVWSQLAREGEVVASRWPTRTANLQPCGRRSRGGSGTAGVGWDATAAKACIRWRAAAACCSLTCTAYTYVLADHGKLAFRMPSSSRAVGECLHQGYRWICLGLS
jgi:hypothetical protein